MATVGESSFSQEPIVSQCLSFPYLKVICGKVGCNWKHKPPCVHKSLVTLTVCSCNIIVYLKSSLGSFIGSQL